MHTGLPPVMWGTDSDCLFSLFTLRPFLCVTEFNNIVCPEDGGSMFL
jgi:hypothetical protein